MNKEMLAYFIELLDVRLTEFTRAMRSLHPSLGENDDHQEPMDDVDLTAKGCEQKLQIQIQHRTRQVILEIEEALLRIKRGIFGICVACGRDIEVNRLKVQPTTTLCIHCKREMEATNRRRVA